MAEAAPAFDTVVILIHGIRTAARWQSRVAALLEAETGARVIPLKYGYFDTLRFLCPFRLCRSGPIERLRRQIDGIRDQYPGKRLVIFAHSFGTYALSRILMENPHFRFDRVILCGSIIPEGYDWSRVDSQITASEKRQAIINDCGTRDVWPVLARSVTWGYGASGTYGFGSFNVTDRFHPLRHSDFFDGEFVRKFWIPAARGEAPAFSPGDKAELHSPGWFQAFGLPLRWLMPAGAAAVLAFAGVKAAPMFGACGPGQVAVGGECHATAGLKSRAELTEKISTLITEVQRTLDIKGGSLFPAMDDYIAGPSPDRWTAVRTGATTLLDHLEKSLKDITEYDMKMVEDTDDGKVYFIASDAKLLVSDNFLKAFDEVKTHFIGRSAIASAMRTAGNEPSADKVRAWKSELEELHGKLQRALGGLLDLLPDA
jgi:pimeloyl-ACP methyl ester carboxylesterase